MRVAIIGAGPAGLTAAYCLMQSSSEVQVQVLEASRQVGGMARSFALWDQTVDLGPHRFFSADPRVNALWLEVAAADYRLVQRLTRIYYNRRFYRYPLQPLEALRQLGVGESLRCLFSYFREQLRPTRQDDSFEGWVQRRFGRRLYEIFFQSYSEKLWGIPGTELDADFAVQRIKKLSLWEALIHAFGGGRKHRTLLDQFAYPCQGTGMIYSRMADAVRAHGGQVQLGCRVREVLVENGCARGVRLEDGTTLEASHVISSMPLTQLVQRLDGVPESVLHASRQLRFRNTVLVYVLVDGSGLFPDNWLYVHSANVRVGRITNFRNWAPELHGAEPHTILACEYWCNTEDDFWQWNNERLGELAACELRQTGLIANRRILAHHVERVPNCYPVYARGYRRWLEPIENYLRGIENLHPIGRYGAFKYNNQDHSILMGLLASEKILQGRGHDLWRINTEDVYQERPEVAPGLRV